MVVPAHGTRPRYGRLSSAIRCDARSKARRGAGMGRDIARRGAQHSAQGRATQHAGARDTARRGARHSAQGRATQRAGARAAHGHDTAARPATRPAEGLRHDAIVPTIRHARAAMGAPVRIWVCWLGQQTVQLVHPACFWTQYCF